MSRGDYDSLHSNTEIVSRAAGELIDSDLPLLRGGPDRTEEEKVSFFLLLDS